VDDLLQEAKGLSLREGRPIKKAPVGEADRGKAMAKWGRGFRGGLHHCLLERGVARGLGRPSKGVNSKEKKIRRNNFQVEEGGYEDRSYLEKKKRIKERYSPGKNKSYLSY